MQVFPSNTLLALLMISLGTGFFKPNASTLVGRLYSPTEASLRDSGFSIFYCAINVGAFFAPLVRVCPHPPCSCKASRESHSDAGGCRPRRGVAIT
jgi:hypothetical protein